MEEKLLPPLPDALVRARRAPPSHTSQRSAVHTSRQLSPVSEVPHPSEIQTMQLEVDILKRELATARRQAGEMERQMASLKKETQRYQLQINRQNCLVAHIFDAIKLVYSNDHQIAAERFQFTETALAGVRQVPRQEDGGWI
ncbi:hypothetical protein B0H66DRAFT_596013 [Apodospora peruviana]|uniref:Uncharacterized protein n=1 Tax=Apodospora peruviana TaxID=516989 RepID=A0AAE0LYD9_9PEZI|nr:hypothetical protein B0H66DRAFT_596013 [Apodospora peruviana]